MFTKNIVPLSLNNDNGTSELSFDDIKKTYSKFVFTMNNNEEITIYLTNAPLDAYLNEYQKYMKKKNVTDIFCFCYNRTMYDETKITDINYHNLSFPDGTIS